jgi:histidinol-phosphate phosphatase family protein
VRAVILAGGQGERMKPLTRSIPKALTPIEGVPIIKKQIDMLTALGVRDFLILTGYKSEMLHDFLEGAFKENEPRVECVATPPEFSPAQRLMHSFTKLDGDILLVYCDNLIYDDDSLNFVLKSTEPLTFLAEERGPGNLTLTPRVEYKSQRTELSTLVELGFMKINGNLLVQSLVKEESLQNALEQITMKYECAVVVTSQKLISVSSIQRYISLRSSRRTILLDRDGILNHKMPHREYLSKIEEFHLIDANITSLSLKYSESTDFIIVTNQPGISTKQVTPEFLEFIHSKLIIELLLRGISVIGLYVCTHHWDENCECRKPKPGMINQAISDYKLDSNKIVYIGDEQKDLDAAQNAGILGVRISQEKSELNFKSLDDSFNFIHAHIS